MTDEPALSSELAEGHCEPCQEGAPPLAGTALEELGKKLDATWRIVDEHHLENSYEFDNFRQALDFTNAVGELAEQQGHHPEITLEWGRVTIRIWTHKIDGLTQSDFVLAAKIEKAHSQSSTG